MTDNSSEAVAVTGDDLDLPPELPPPLPPATSAAGNPTTTDRWAFDQIPAVASVVAVIGLAISAAIGVGVVYGVVYGVVALVGYLTEAGLTASIMGLSVALWPVALMLAGIASDNRFKESKALLNAVAFGLVALPAMVALRMFVSIHLSNSPRLNPAPWSGINFVAAVLAGVLWGLLGGFLAFAAVYGKSATAANFSNKKGDV